MSELLRNAVTGAPARARAERGVAEVSMRVLPNAVLAGCCLVLIGLLLAFNAYVFVINGTNHTGLPLGGLKWGLGCCAAAAAALGPAALRGTVARGWWWALLAVSLLGLANIAAFERLGIMLEYDEWIRRGMPDGGASCPEAPDVTSALRGLDGSRSVDEAMPYLRALERQPRIAACHLVNRLAEVHLERLDHDTHDDGAWSAIWTVRALRFLTGGMNMVAATGTRPGGGARDEMLRRDGPDAIPFFTVWPSRDVTFVAPVDTQEAIIAKWRRWFAKASDGFVFKSAGSLDDWYF